jgi:regulator of cell morphogenesis and NO signaling
MPHGDGTARGEARTSLGEAFTHEHHQLDAGIEEYLAQDASTDPRRRAGPLLSAMKALRRPIYLEEEIVFPHLPKGPLMMPLMVMRREHGELWQRTDALAEELGGDGAAEGLEDACQSLLFLLDDHNSKEEPIIYPHLDSDLDPSEQERVRVLLEEGTLPEGWICEALR